MREEEGEETEAQTGRESKSSVEENTIPFVTDEAFIEKGGAFSQFPVDILCSLFFPLLPLSFLCPNTPPPLLPVRLRHRGRLFGINKDGCWQMKVVGRDGGLLNTQFASHKSPPASRRHVTATSCNKQLKTHANAL